MKKTIIISIIGAALPLTWGFSQPERAPGLPTEEERAARQAAILEKFDADGNGVLSEDERKAVREAMRERRAARPRGPEGAPPPSSPELRGKILERFDADGDGTLSEAERKQARQAGQARQAARMRKMADTDGDGEISPEEYRSARRKLDPTTERAGPRRLPPEARERILEKFDADGDGTLSEEERATAREAMRENRPPRGKRGGPGE